MIISHRKLRSIVRKGPTFAVGGTRTYCSTYHASNLTEAEKNARRRAFYKRETDHLREMRVLNAKSIGAVQGRHNRLADNYEVLKILGKGSFGVVRLVREKTRPGDPGYDMRKGKPVYAMKVIRKSAMLRTSQEAHLRAERDFLVASEGSKWLVFFFFIFLY